MRPPKYMQNVLIGATAALFAGVRLVPGTEKSGPVLTAATELVTGKPAATTPDSAVTETAASSAMAATAVTTLSAVVRPLSHPNALQDAFKSYFAYKTAHP